MYPLTDEKVNCHVCLHIFLYIIHIDICLSRMTKRSNEHLIKSLKLRPCPFVLIELPFSIIFE